ncbi:MAG: GDP-mannose 4,6-dehydratase [Candidatus Zambryskibacteria bacterium]|nr:GDP-mannose 4,6-dehydratase [Candidatus Zambryskibacteria bacterium]
MKKILVTGGAGFIGYHLIKKLLEDDKNSEIFVIDNLQRGKLDENFSSIVSNKRIKFIQGDLTDLDFYKSLSNNFDHIYHLAAINGTRYFYEIPHEVLRVNTLTLINILEWIKNFPVKPKFLFTSSNEAYAGALETFKQLPIPTPEDVPLIVNDPFNPRWSYGGSKLIGEIFVVHYANQYHIPSIIVRPHNFYGPRAGEDHVIPALSLKIIKKMDPFELYSPKQTRSFCYISDAVEAMVLLMRRESIFDNKNVDLFHIGSSKETSIKELAENLFEIGKWKPKKIIEKPPLPGSVDRRLPDVSKIEKIVGWKTKTSLKNGLRKTFDWYENL